jgi:hypothetical protein
MIHTLQDYMALTEGVTYILMILFLVGIALFWKFLTGRDEENIGYGHFRQESGSLEEPDEEH